MYSRVGGGGLYLEPYLAILHNREILLLSHYYCVQGGMYSRVVEACALEPDLAIPPAVISCYSHIITVCREECTQGWYWWRPVPWSQTYHPSQQGTPATLPLLLYAGRNVLKGGGGLCPGV
jgi:hypothetical protein